MAKKNRGARQTGAFDTTAEHYYDYEARFIKQKREQERINFLPRVIKPEMFARGEFALGDMRVFSRYTVAPLSTLTCGFLDLGAGKETEPRRMIPSLLAYIIAGGGESIQEESRLAFSAGDLVIVPPYTRYRFAATPDCGFRAWLPQLRLWHGQGLLWRDGQSPVDDAEQQKVATIFDARRRVSTPATGGTRYDWFLSRLAEENRVESEAPRVIRDSDCLWENTRHGRLKFYIDRWTESSARGMDAMAQEIAPNEASGEHRHIFEELLLVLKGRGYDLHEGTKHRWHEGDLICIPPMIAHRHVNDGDEPARLISVWPQQPGHELLGGIEQISDASEWKGQKSEISGQGSDG
ncbi:MAG TPA: cupin domain-containing protein [Candidatus Binatia bacterium]